MMIIYILGTDGAGKTTVAAKLTQQASRNKSAGYLYCQHRPILLLPVKLPARLCFLRGTDQFKDYDHYKAKKDFIVHKRPGLARFYCLLGYLDVLMQTWLKLLAMRLRKEIVIVDRYYLDWVVNFGILKGNSLDGMLRDARRLERVLPRADIHLFLDVSEEIALRRKGDIQALQYLRERKERYLQLARIYNFQIIDANQEIDTVFGQVSARAESVIGYGVKNGPVLAIR